MAPWRAMAIAWAMTALAAGSAAAQSAVCASPAADSLRAALAALTDSGGRPDLLIAASVSARELRFDSRPRTTVRLTGCAALDSVVVTERTNLPKPVEPGVTYRDVRVGVEIRAHLDVQCLLPALAAVRGLEGLCAPARSDTTPPPSPPGPPDAGQPTRPDRPRK